MRNLVGVSVVIPCYRCSETIERAVASVAKQTKLPVEVILVDDCSGDNTLTLLHQIKSNHAHGWIKVIESKNNAGAASARNLGWEAATEPLIAFLDSDDSWHPQKIEIQHGWMSENKGVALTGHTCRQIMLDNSAIEHRVDYSKKSADFQEVSKSQILLSNRFATRSVMLRRDMEFRFKEGKRHSEDFLLWAEICCSGRLCYISSLPLAYLYKAPYGDGGLSAQLWNMERGELDTYSELHRKNHFGLLYLWLISGLSLAKYIRRLFKQFSRS